ncbi:hypothetical protein HHL28_01510 [Aerophototrophica crusticola]|uniref:Uncharacterized protein n=1 Tax=Aerophototrophica crusticola TaxID=1709002 RepID=A0A858R3I4_9PROT|nr:hypothetical protein HHL28_01510 [Rhodospirillaceae bacterium B3]
MPWKPRFVTYVPTPDKPYSETEAGKAEIARLQAMGDKDIDFSDIPPAPDSNWMTAEQARTFRMSRRKAER